MTKLALALLVMSCALTACGVTTIPNDGDAGGSGGGNGGAGADGGSDAQPSDAKADAVDCEVVREQLGTLLERARVCDPAINMVQCNVVVQGLCCPQVVVQASAQATNAYLYAVEQAQTLGCDDICAVVDCAPTAGGFCQPDPTGVHPGVCEDIY